MILAIAGSRHSGSALTIGRFVERFGLAPSKVLHGGALGVDAAADAWAKERDIPVEPFPADWQRYKRAAGPIRNVIMLKRAGGLLALPCSHSKGTLRAIEIATELGIPVWSSYIGCGDAIRLEGI